MNYLFHSNYPYFEALHLGRFLRWLAQIECVLGAGSNPTQRLCHMAYHAGSVVFKDRLFDPGIPADEFALRLAEEKRRSAMSEEELEREMESLAERLRNGEFDLDDDSEAELAWRSPVPDRNRVVEFVRAARDALLPLAEFTVPGDSLIEDLAADYTRTPATRVNLRGFYGLITAWDPMRMRFEGRPPYSISYTPMFTESMEEMLKDEGDPEPDVTVAGLLERLTEERDYRMRSEDYKEAYAGLERACRAKVVPEAVIRRLLRQLDQWRTVDG